MAEIRKEKEVKFWNFFAGHYDTFMKTKEKTYEILFDLMGKRLDSNMTILDMAAGTGYVAFWAASRVKKVVACDLSEAMIEEARKKAETKGYTNIEFEIQDAYDLPYAGKSFDVVMIANALHIMMEPDRALMEARRVLKDDGILLAPTFILNTNTLSKYISELMGLTGYRCYHNFTGLSLKTYIEDRGFQVIQSGRINGLLPEQYIAAKKAEPQIWSRNKQTRRRKTWNKKMHGRNMTRSSWR